MNGRPSLPCTLFICLIRSWTPTERWRRRRSQLASSLKDLEAQVSRMTARLKEVKRAREALSPLLRPPEVENPTPEAPLPAGEIFVGEVLEAAGKQNNEGRILPQP